MARFTVADCMENIDNHFNLTLAASVRARQIANGSPTLIKSINRDKPVVLALREIAEGLIDKSILKNLD